MLRAFFLFQLIPRSIIIIQLSIVLTMNSFLKIFRVSRKTQLYPLPLMRIIS